MNAPVSRPSVAEDAPQQLLGHNDVSTTMIYTHIMKTGPLGVISPADRIKVDPVTAAPELPASVSAAELASAPPASRRSGRDPGRDRVGVSFTPPRARASVNLSRALNSLLALLGHGLLSMWKSWTTQGG